MAPSSKLRRSLRSVGSWQSKARGWRKGIYRRAHINAEDCTERIHTRRPFTPQPKEALSNPSTSGNGLHRCSAIRCACCEPYRRKQAEQCSRQFGMGTTEREYCTLLQNRSTPRSRFVWREKSTLETFTITSSRDSFNERCRWRSRVGAAVWSFTVSHSIYTSRETLGVASKTSEWPEDLRVRQYPESR